MDSDKYDQLHGFDGEWDKLLDPLDLDLRKLLISYGDLAGAGRALNTDKGSRYCGYSHYGKSSFFKGVMLPCADSKYEVASFLYATARIDFPIPFLFTGLFNKGSKFASNWMGYIAVSNDEFSASIGRREICVVWRGTTGDYQFIDDLDAKLVSPEPVLHQPSISMPFTEKPLVMEGWLTIYNTSDPDSKFVKSSAREQLLARIKELLIKYKDEKLSITCIGHSLGASLAVLSALDLTVNIVPSNIRVSSFAFACPRVGNKAFKKRIEEQQNLKILRVTNALDIVPTWPRTIPPFFDYADVGKEILIDNRKSPYLKEESSYGLPLVYWIMFHDIFGMLHTLSGWNGDNGEFDLNLLNRSLALANMGNDLLKEDCGIPPSWWAEKNKGIVLKGDGQWVLPPIDPVDHDLPDVDLASIKTI